MAVRTYGELVYDLVNNQFTITEAEPHICIRLKQLFPSIRKNSVAPFHFKNTPEICTDLRWFIDRYPLSITEGCMFGLEVGANIYRQNINELEEILTPDYQPRTVNLKGDVVPRDYQLRGAETFLKTKRLLLGDDLGLGKTLTAILSLFEPKTLPAVIVVQTHMVAQWREQVQRFTNLRVHVINVTKPYNLPPADVYIMKYSCLIGWVDLFTKSYFKTVIYDECQELRRSESKRYDAAKTLSGTCIYSLGLSATPIYNFGDEIYNVLEAISPGCLGNSWDFMREWAGYGRRIAEPKALGTYLRERFLFLRRTRADVGRELPPINKIVQLVGYDEKEVQKSEDLARALAKKVVSGSFIERGGAARELDMLARQTTGVSKAREVAGYVKILLENDEPVVLAGWHREVYDIWLKELAEYDPVMYTGTESPAQKEKAKQDFIAGKTKLFIISLRSGAGLDGLQHVCKTVVIGELDWSPKVHDQLIARVDRDGQQEPVTAIFLVSEYGSDPVVIELLGLKSSQAHGIVDPMQAVGDQRSDDSRIKALAMRYLNKNGEKYE